MQEALLAAAIDVARRRAAGQPARAGSSGWHPAAWPTSTAAMTPAAAGRSWPLRGPAAARTRPPGRDDTLILMFMCCHPSLTPALGHPAHAPRGRRPDHPRDRCRVPGPRGDHGPADQPGQGQDQGARASRSRSRRPISARNGCARCCTSSTCSSTRATPPAAVPSLARTDLSGEAIRLARVIHAAAARGRQRRPGCSR